MSILTLTKLSLSNKGLKDSDNIFEELLYLKDLVELDLSCNLLSFIPDNLSPLENLKILDITDNPFEDFERVTAALTSLPNLIDLKINIADQDQAIIVLSNLPNLEILNGKSTRNEEPEKIDIEEKEAEVYSLNEEIGNFNSIFTKIEKLKSMRNQNPIGLKEEFHSLLTSEVGKINKAVEDKVPNFLYAGYLLDSKLRIYSFFQKKALSIIDKKEPEVHRLLSEAISQYESTANSLYELFLKLEGRILEETERNQKTVSHSVGESSKIQKENESLLKRIKAIEEEKKFLIIQQEEERGILYDKINKLENENKRMTEAMILKGKSDDNPQIPSVNKSVVLNRSSVNLSEIRPKANSAIIGPIGSRVLTKKMLLEIIEEIYASKEAFDRKCGENKMPKETMEQHMYTYLNQKYGLKNLIIEWATSIINAIRMFSPEDAEICMFGKILRNEIEEDCRLIINKLKITVPEILNCLLKSKYPLKSNGDIKDLTYTKLNGLLLEEEWKKIISYLYDRSEAGLIENKVTEYIKRKYFGETDKIEPGKKLTREEIQNLSKMKEDYRIQYCDFFKILLDHNIRVRDKYLRNFCYLFRTVDRDNNGIISEEEFVFLLSKMNVFDSKVFNENANRLLNLIDPFNNKQIIFSDCVTLFSDEYPNQDSDSRVKYNLLDLVAMNKDILSS